MLDDGDEDRLGSAALGGAGSDGLGFGAALASVGLGSDTVERYTTGAQESPSLFQRCCALAIMPMPT